jgi:hypothetical protein
LIHQRIYWNRLAANQISQVVVHIISDFFQSRANPVAGALGEEVSDPFAQVFCWVSEMKANDKYIGSSQV